ncbi:MAG: hypothetical protein ACLQGJ_04245 [Candidatus Dormibacteria bacterium]
MDWLAVVAALIAAAITATASLGVVWFQERLRRKATAQQTLATACAVMLWRSMGVLLRAHTLGVTAVVRWGLPEAMDIVMRRRQPMDPLALYDWYAQDWAPLFEAWSTIWLHGDQEMVGLANDVFGRSGDLMTVMTRAATPTATWRRVADWIFGRNPPSALTPEQEKAVKRLAEARKRFANYVRTHLGASAVELFAQLEAAESGASEGGPSRRRDGRSTTAEGRVGLPVSP